MVPEKVLMGESKRGIGKSGELNTTAVGGGGAGEGDATVAQIKGEES